VISSESKTSHASFSIKLYFTSVWFAMGVVTVYQGLLFLLALVFCSANSPPSLSGKVMQRVPVRIGKNIKQPCNAQSDMPELTQWKKDGQSINPGWDRFKISQDGELRIRDVEKSDAGLYTCIATNGFGSVNVNYTIIVIDDEKQVFYEGDKEYQITADEDLTRDGSPPYFEDLDIMRKSMHLEKPVRSTIKLTCKAEGNPRPEFTWLKNGHSLPQRRSHIKMTELTQADSGAYTCVARNRLGQVNFTYDVEIIDEISEKPKLIAPHPLSQNVTVGSPVTFQCFIESGVKPEVKWLKRLDHSEAIPPANVIEYDGERFIVLKNAGVLLEKQDGHYLNKYVLSKVQPKDAGTFVCFATNRRGFTTRQAHLTVRQGPYVVENSEEEIEKAFNNSSNQSSESAETNLPLLIGLPSCAVLFFILLAVFLMQRNNRCHRSDNSVKKSPRPPVPPHERDAFYYSSCQQQQQQTVNPLLTSREKLPPKTPTPSMDMTCSEFSSVSRNHPQYYNPNHVTYGY
ncbi:fibroblast growth factor receptor-like 1, partial [Biomphalaria glabrata]